MLTRAGGAVLDRVLAWPRTVLAAALLVGLAAAASLLDPATGTPRFDVAPAMAALLPADGEARETLERARRLFGDDDVVLVAWFAKDLFSPARLAALKRFTRALEALPGVSRVDGLANATDVRGTAEEAVVDAFLREVPANPQAAGEARARALANPLLRGRLVGLDGASTLVVVRFSPALDAATLRARVARIRALSAAHAGGAEQIVSGPLPVRLEVGRLLLADLLRVMPLAVIATFAVCFAAFRSVAGVLLPMLANGAAALLTLALFVARGHALDFVTVILPPVVYVVGFAYAIHVLTEHERARAGGLAGGAAVRAACASVFAPLALTAVTTVAAFLAIATSELAAIRTFGLYAALGVGLAWLGAMIVVPAGLVVLGPAPRRVTASAVWAGRLARFAAQRRTAVLAAAALLALVAGAGATRIEVDTAVLRDFGPDSGVREGFERIAASFAGPVPLRVLLEADAPDGFRDPARLREVDALAAWLASQPEVGGVYSLADYVRLVHRALAPDAAADGSLPSSARLVNHLLLLGGGPDLRHFLDPSSRAALVHVQTAALSTAAVNALAARIEARLDALPEGLGGTVTGTSALSARGIDAIATGQVRSLAVAFAVVLAILVLAFGSLRIGAVALVPNVLPILFYFGLLGWAGITLNLTTSLVACAVFGIAIDDSVHFLARYGEACARRGRGTAAVGETLAAVLRPVGLTTLALVAGFAVLVAGSLRSQAEFGLLAAATLAFAWLVDVTFTPALCHALDVRPAWRRLIR